MAEVIDVTTKVARPPDGYCAPEHRYPQDGDIAWTGKQWNVVHIHQLWNNAYFCCRRLPADPQLPRDAAPGTTFYPYQEKWYVTDSGVYQPKGDIANWTPRSCHWMPATIFADWVEPKERRPFTKGKA